MATQVPNPLNLTPLVVEPVGDSSDKAGQRVVPPDPMMGNAKLMGKLKKVNKQLKMIDLKKSANLMAAGFYCCIIAMSFFYLLFICR